jgi:protein-S-isoprenylcysteine O-methyltransferase Ste14
MRGWVFLAILGLTLAVNLAVILILNPSVLRTRLRWRKPSYGPDKIFLILYWVALVSLFVVAWRDVGNWTGRPAGDLRWWIGLFLHILGDIPLLWALLVNPFVEPTIRIQEEKGHKTVTDGPYRFIRHPMYAGMIFLFAGWPLLLDSLWVFLPVVVIEFLIVARTHFEDRTLERELSGYRAYTEKVPFRLIPHLW